MSAKVENVEVKDDSAEEDDTEVEKGGVPENNEDGKPQLAVCIEREDANGGSPENNIGDESTDQTEANQDATISEKKKTRRKTMLVEVLLPPERKRKSEANVKHLNKVMKMPDTSALVGRHEDDKKKLDVAVASTKVTSVGSSKLKKPGGWTILNKTFNPDFDGPMEPNSVVSYDISSQPTSILAATSSLVSDELNKEHAGRTQDFGNDLLNRIQQKRKMAQLLMKQLNKGKDTKTAKPNTVMMAFMSFWNSAKRKQDFLIPKDRAAWLEFLVQLVRRKTKIQYLSNKELKKVIIRTRPNLAHKKHILSDDPDCPECFFWDENQVADWVESVGFPNLREAFLLNCISGRRLVTVDVNALRQMGMKYFDEMKNLAGKIRELIGLPRPNILRAIMRIVPFEQYLRKRVDSGKTYDMLNFETFCHDNNFDYNTLKTNKNAVIPCTVEVFMVPTGIIDEDADTEKEGSEEEEISLLNAPTVEFVVRNSIIRNKIVTKIIEDLLKAVLVGQGKKLKGVKETMKESLYWGLSELGLDDQLRAKERLEFATSVAQALLKEIHKTSLVLEDIEQVERYTGEKVNPEKKEYLKEVAEKFMEDVMPLVGVLALGELDLEVIFRDATGMEEYIDEILDEAQRAVSAECGEAEEFISGVCDEAYQIVQKMQGDGFTDELLPFEVENVAHDIIEELLTNAYIIEAVGRGAQAEAFNIVAESQEEDMLTKLDELSKEVVEEEPVTDFDNPEFRIEGKEKKDHTLTNLQTAVDKEVKIGMIQLSTDKSSKGRKKRTELTVSDSLSKGRVNQPNSPTVVGSHIRKVGSDTTLLRSPQRPNTSAFSLKSNSTGEFSVDSANLRAQYSEAFKQIANERIQRVTDKSKLYMQKLQMDTKAFSVPTSPLIDGEKEALRKTVSNIPKRTVSSGYLGNIKASDKEKYKDTLGVKGAKDAKVFTSSNVEKIKAGSSDADTGLMPVRRSEKEGNLYQKEKDQKSIIESTKEKHSEEHTRSNAGEGYTRSAVGEGPTSAGPSAKGGTIYQKEREPKSTYESTKEKYSEEPTPSGVGEGPTSPGPLTKGGTIYQKEKELKSTSESTKDSPTPKGAGEGSTPAGPSTKGGTIYQKEKELTSGSTKEKYSEEPTPSGAGERSTARPSSIDGTLHQKEKEQKFITRPASEKYFYGEGFIPIETEETAPTRPSTKDSTSHQNEKEPKSTSKVVSERYLFGEGFIPLDSADDTAPTRSPTKDGTSQEKFVEGIVPGDEELGLIPVRPSTKEGDLSLRERKKKSESTEENYTEGSTPRDEGEGTTPAGPSAKENISEQKRKEKRSESAAGKYYEKFTPGEREKMASEPSKAQEKRAMQLALGTPDKLEKGDHAKAVVAQDQREGDGEVTDGGIRATRLVEEKKHLKDGENLAKPYKLKLAISSEDFSSIAEFHELQLMNRRALLNEKDPEKMTVLFRGSNIDDTEVDSSDADAEGGPMSARARASRLRIAKEKEADGIFPSASTSQIPERPEPTKRIVHFEKVPSKIEISMGPSKMLNHRTMSLASFSDSDGSIDRPKSDISVASVESEPDKDDDKLDERTLAMKAMLKEKKLHRRQLVENWAHEMDMTSGSVKTEKYDDSEEQARILRISADQIVSDIIQLALTHMLLTAESGNDADNLMNALMKIQVREDDSQEDNQIILWEPHIPQAGKATLGEFRRKKAEFASPKVSTQNLSTKEGLKKASKEEIVSAKKGLVQKPQVEETKTRRYNKAGMKHRPQPKPQESDDEEITRL